MYVKLWCFRTKKIFWETIFRFDLRLLPRDHLMFECTYNSTGREGITRGGFSSDSEMCTMFLHYYPAAR